MRQVSDVFSEEKRSWVMSRVRGKDTTPERKVRSLLFAMGYRFRLHRKDLPGNPDIVFPGRKCVIFVHGCFWHGHDCARGARVPKNNRDYWVAKIARNVERDRKNQAALSALGWSVLVLWECGMRDDASLERLLRDFLENRA